MLEKSEILEILTREVLSRASILVLMRRSREKKINSPRNFHKNKKIIIINLVESNEH